MWKEILFILYSASDFPSKNNLFPRSASVGTDLVEYKYECGFHPPIFGKGGKVFRCWN